MVKGSKPKKKTRRDSKFGHPQVEALEGQRKKKKPQHRRLSVATRVQHNVGSSWLVTHNDSALYPHFNVVVKPDNNLHPL